MTIQKSVTHPTCPAIVANFEIRNSGDLSNYGSQSHIRTSSPETAGYAGGGAIILSSHQLNMTHSVSNNVLRNPEAAAQIALDGNILTKKEAAKGRVAVPSSAGHPDSDENAVAAEIHRDGVAALTKPITGVQQQGCTSNRTSFFASLLLPMTAKCPKCNCLLGQLNLGKIVPFSTEDRKVEMEVLEEAYDMSHPDVEDMWNRGSDDHPGENPFPDPLHITDDGDEVYWSLAEVTLWNQKRVEATIVRAQESLALVVNELVVASQGLTAVLQHFLPEGMTMDEDDEEWDDEDGDEDS